MMYSSLLSPTYISHSTRSPIASTSCSRRPRRSFGARRARGYRSWGHLNELTALTARVAHDLWTSLELERAEISLTNTATEYTLEMNLPELVGRQLNELELNVEGDVLTLSIPALELPEVEGLRPLWEEIKSDARQEKIRLPADVDVDQIDAQLSGESLRLRLPKHVPVKRSIKIN